MIDSDKDWLALMAPNLAIAVAVLEEEHVTRAANRLGVPQPTVSHALRRMNETIGAPLVQRVGRGVVPTAAGRAFLPAAREALATLRAARQELADVIDPERGQVCLGFLHTLGVRDVPRLLDAFLAAHPDVRFALTQGPALALLDRMRAGEIDVVITAPIPEDKTLHSVVLRDEQLFLAVPAWHRLAQRETVELRQAAGERFIALTLGHGLRQVFDEMCAAAGFEADLAFEGEDVATLRGLVSTGLGVAVLPGSPAPEEGVTYLPIGHPPAHRLLGGVWPATRRLPPPARRFTEFLIQSGREVLGER
ncbi:LysR family transcriptional regulator [Streptomyces hygroscopicus]|uniref:LysR family transcriptional regulator n=1 Tax=Streptomyces hygroscopicus TaxID=1912 RepID=UPI0036BBEADB